MIKFQKIALLIIAVFSASLAYAEPEVNPIPKVSDEWRFSITPYVWAPGMNSTMSFRNTEIAHADMSGSNVLSKVSAAATISAEAHKGNWGVMGDLVYSQMNNQGAKVFDHVDLGSSVNLKNTIFTGAVTYTMANTPDVYLDGLLGVRSISTTANLNVRVTGYPLNASVTNTTSTVDPVIGLKGRFRLADSSWYIPLYADVGSGGGTTNVTWQAMTGIAKGFSWGDITLAYRALYYDMKAGATLQKATMSGLALGATFNF